MINKTLMKKWVDALRSGKYNQGFGQLRCNDKFCCLGVLCDISKEGEWTRYGYRVGESDMHGYPSSEMLKKTNIHSKFVNKLIEMNDAQKKSFTEIADYIEKNLVEEPQMSSKKFDLLKENIVSYVETEEAATLFNIDKYFTRNVRGTKNIQKRSDDVIAAVGTLIAEGRLTQAFFTITGDGCETQVRVILPAKTKFLASNQL